MRKLISAMKIIAVISAAALLFSGCSLFTISSVESLLRAPKLTGENAEIQKAFEQAAGTDATLINPLTGSFRSAYIQYDYDNDSVEEVIVFYLPGGSTGEAHAHFLDYDGDKWQSSGDLTGSGSEVYMVDFCDINSDSKSEIAITWTVSDSRITKNLSLYGIGEASMNASSGVYSLATIQLSDYLFLDVDFDGQTEIFYTYFDSSSPAKAVAAKLLKYNTDERAFFPISEISLNPQTASFAAFTSFVNNALRWIYIDCLKADGSLFTELVYFDTEKSALVAPLLANSADSSLITSRNVEKYCKDENADTVFEIPVEYKYEGSYILNAPESHSNDVNILDWKQYVNGELISVNKYYINENDNYMLRVNSLIDEAYVTYDYSNNTARFRLRSMSEESNILFSITCQHLSEESSGSVNAKQMTITVTELGKTMNLNQNYIKTLITGN